MSYEEKPTLTVKQLIKKLKALPKEVQDYEVQADGCDCIGPATDIDVVSPHPKYPNRKGYVLVAR